MKKSILFMLVLSMIAGCESKDEYIEPSIFAVLSSPETHQNQAIGIAGIVRKTSNGPWRLYPTETQAKHNDIASSVSLGTTNLSLECDNQFVRIVGKSAAYSGVYLEMASITGATSDIKGFSCLSKKN